MIKAEWTNKDSLDLQPTCNQLATTEGDLINRADAINCIKWGEGVTDVIERIESLPSADRPTGEWQDEHGKPMCLGSFAGYCSNCGNWSEYLTDYCGNCGAKMGGGE